MPAAAAPPPTSRPTPTPTSLEGRMASSARGAAGSAAASASAIGAGGATHPSAASAPLLGTKLQSLLSGIDPTWTLDAAAEEQILDLCDDFLEKVCRQMVKLAQHRGSHVVDVSDVQMVLAKGWNLTVPGLGPPASALAPPGKKKGATAASASAASMNSSGRGTSAGHLSRPGLQKRKSSIGSVASAASSSGGQQHQQQPPPHKVMRTSSSSASVSAGVAAQP
jgi:Transcription initiation factor TFIID subunit A